MSAIINVSLRGATDFVATLQSRGSALVNKVAFQRIATSNEGHVFLAILRYAPRFPKDMGRHICEGIRRKDSGSAEDN